jgi:hypothetical protein
MIVFDLRCHNGHTFEGWFEDGSAYKTQRESGLIGCPLCNSTDIQKIPSTFGIKGSCQTGQNQEVQRAGIDYEQLGRRVMEYLNKNFDNVGPDFAKEALKMHYGVVKPRNIRGVSTPQEEKTLKEEGIEFFKVPITTNRSSSSDTDS